MLALLAVLIGAGDIDREVRPKVPLLPVIPIPNGKADPDYRYRLFTDWAPPTRSPSAWRTATRIEDTDRWEEAVLGQRGGRNRELYAEGELSRTTATTGRTHAGSGGVGEGFEWSVFVGGSWTAGLDVEFTLSGPRVVVALVYYPYEGVTHRYGWSVLSGQLVHGIGWHLRENELQAMYYWPRLLAWASWRSLLPTYPLDREE